MQITPEIQAKIDALPTAEQIAAMTEYKGKQVIDSVVCPECGKPIQHITRHLKARHKSLDKNKCKEIYQTLMKPNTIMRFFVMQQTKTTERMLRKYGVESPWQIPECKEQIAKLNTERYGAARPGGTKIVQERIKKTNMERFGVEHSLQNKEIREKGKQTNLKRYGVTNGGATPQALNKRKHTNIERYGTEFPLLNPEIQKKFKETCLQNLNATNPFKSKKVKKMMESIYGGSGWGSEIIFQKIKNTCKKRYGAEFFIQSNYWTNDYLSQYKNYTLPSGRIIKVQGFEPQALNYLFNVENRDEVDFLYGTEMSKQVHILWYDKHIWHRYYPDIYDVSNNNIIEVKSEYTINNKFFVKSKFKDINVLELKKQATLKAGFNYRLMVMEQDGTCISDTTTYKNLANKEC